MAFFIFCTINIAIVLKLSRVTLSKKKILAVDFVTVTAQKGRMSTFTIKHHILATFSLQKSGIATL